MNRSSRLAAALLIILLGAMPLLAVSPPERCGSKPEYRQLDFWLGDWEVSPSQGQPDAGKVEATSHEEKIVGGCIFLESYAENGGYTGKSLNFYDGAIEKWRQTWVDSVGNVSEFSGELKDGVMQMEGESHTADGRRILRKMTLSPLPGGRVRQYSEASRDGKTWKPLYDYTYSRKK
jgi:hypothetical protein